MEVGISRREEHAMNAAAMKVKYASIRLAVARKCEHAAEAVMEKARTERHDAFKELSKAQKAYGHVVDTIAAGQFDTIRKRQLAKARRQAKALTRSKRLRGIRLR